MTDVLRVATYNVHSWRGADGRIDPARALEVVRKLGADIVGLQEVTLLAGPPAVGEGGLPPRAAARSPAPQPHRTEALLEKATGLRAFSGATMQRPDGSYGNLLLTRHPVEAVRRHHLSMRGREPRGALDLDVRVQGALVRVIVTHLGLNPAERTWQARRLVELLEGSRADDIVLLGDFNQWFPWWGSLRPLHRWFHTAPYRRTFPARWPLFPLDRIFVNPWPRLERLEVHRSPLARLASDHLPLCADLHPLDGT